MAKLKVIGGDQAELALKGGKDRVLGSSATADLRLKADGVARKHFKICFYSQVWMLTPIADTQVNGEPVSGETELKNGDKIQAGTAVLELVTEDTGMLGSSGGISEGDLAGLM